MKNELPVVLKELRKDKNITQKEIAETINVTERAYCFYENGSREPAIDTLIKIAEYYNIPIDVLVGRYKINKS